MVGGPGQGAHLAQRGRHPRQGVDRVDLPGEVVEAGGAPRRTSRLGTDLEEAEVVVVATVGRAQEHRAHARRALELHEAEGASVERRRDVHVADEEDRVVQAGDAPWRYGSSFQAEDQLQPLAALRLMLRKAMASGPGPARACRRAAD